MSKIIWLMVLVVENIFLTMIDKNGKTITIKKGDKVEVPKNIFDSYSNSFEVIDGEASKDINAEFVKLVKSLKVAQIDKFYEGFTLTDEQKEEYDKMNLETKKQTLIDSTEDENIEEYTKSLLAIKG